MVRERLIPSGESGNLLITGMPDSGARTAFMQSIYESLEEGNPVFAVLDLANPKARTGLLSRAKLAGYRTLNLNPDNAEAQSFNLLLAGRTPEEKAEILWSLLERPGDPPDLSEHARRNLRMAIRVLTERDGEATPEKVLAMKVEDIAAGTEVLFGDEGEKEDALIYLSRDKAYEVWGAISDRAAPLRGRGIIKSLSGTEDIRKLLSGKMFALVSATPAERELLPGFDRLTNAMARVFLSIGEEKNTSGRDWHLFLKEGQNLRPQTLRSLLAMGEESRCLPPALCLYQESLVDLFSVHSESVLDYFRHLAIFRTNDGSYWSRFFGTSPMVQTTETYGRKKDLLHLPQVRGGTVARGGYREEGYSTHIEEKPVYETRVFKNLADNEFLRYDAKKHRSGKGRTD